MSASYSVCDSDERDKGIVIVFDVQQHFRQNMEDMERVSRW